jgi:hypothetical protein
MIGFLELVVVGFAFLFLLAVVYETGKTVGENNSERTEMFNVADEADRDDRYEVREIDELESKIDELDDAMSTPANDFELLSNRSAKDALLWARGVDHVDVVADLDAYQKEQGEA